MRLNVENCNKFIITLFSFNSTKLSNTLDHESSKSIISAVYSDYAKLKDIYNFPEPQLKKINWLCNFLENFIEADIYPQQLISTQTPDDICVTNKDQPQDASYFANVRERVDLMQSKLKNVLSEVYYRNVDENLIKKDSFRSSINKQGILDLSIQQLEAHVDLIYDISYNEKYGKTLK